jgi:cytochrome c peroxidase
MNCRQGLFTGILAVVLSACGGGGGGGGGGSGNVPPPPPPPPPPSSDSVLRALIADLGLSGDPAAGRVLPSIEDPLAQLGKKLFFTKSLSGDFDTACATCHHPALGGGDALSLSIGPGADSPEVLGPGRSHSGGEMMARNAPTTFNIGLYDAGLFHDSRIESIGKVAGANGAGTGIRTPDTPLNVEDPNAGETLPAAQLRFPVTVADEMRGHSFLAGADNETIRNRLAARIGDYDEGAGELGENSWLEEFQAAFASGLPAEQLISFDNIALAIAEYQRSQVFVATPWRAYVQGDNGAISETAKQGALHFLRTPEQGGAGCSQCHSGDFFTNEQHHTIGFPQVGPGKGDGDAGDDDFGRERETGLQEDRYRFRTPTLLNIEVTGPYTHSGAYTGLVQATDHYAVPDIFIDDFFAADGMCGLPQFRDDPDCATRFPNVLANTQAAFQKMRAEQTADPDATFPDVSQQTTQQQFDQIRAFLLALTDPCVKDRACLAPWIPEPDEDPDGNQLNAVAQNGDPL